MKLQSALGSLRVIAGQRTRRALRPQPERSHAADIATAAKTMNRHEPSDEEARNRRMVAGILIALVIVALGLAVDSRFWP